MIVEYLQNFSVLYVLSHILGIILIKTHAISTQTNFRKQKLYLLMFKINKN